MKPANFVKVARIKNMIKKGFLKPSAERIAKKMMKNLSNQLRANPFVKIK